MISTLIIIIMFLLCVELVDSTDTRRAFIITALLTALTLILMVTLGVIDLWWNPESPYFSYD